MGSMSLQRKYNLQFFLNSWWWTEMEMWRKIWLTSVKSFWLKMQSMDCFYQVESDWGGEEGPEERSERPKLLKKGKWGVKWVKTHWLSLTRLPLWIPALGFLPCHTDLRYTQSCVSFLAWEGAYYCTCTAWHYDPANRDMYPLLPKSFICICSWTVAVTPRVGWLCSLKFLGNFSSTYLLQLLRAGTVASFVLVQYLAQWVSWVGFLGVIAMITSDLLLQNGKPSLIHKPCNTHMHTQ